MDKIVAIIPAAGKGSRLGLGKNKAFALINGLPMLVQCLKMLAETNLIGRAVVTVPKEEIPEISALVDQYRLLFGEMLIEFAEGGKERQDSVANALKLVGDCEYVAVHDGARPLAGKDLFLRVMSGAYATGAAIAAVPVKDTIKEIDDAGYVTHTPKRDNLRACQTPQIFKTEILKAAYKKLEEEPVPVTDDAMLVERLGVKVVTVMGDYENLKVTTPEDLLTVEKILADREMNKMTVKNRNTFRIGCGYDVHRLVEGRKLILCGVAIPHDKGLLGHSDADVALHALMDAMLGAAAMGDIGKHFPDTDERFAGADSMVLLEKVKKIISDKQWCVNNVDITIMAQKPKIVGYIEAMRTNVARALEIDVDDVSVKATTTEKLGFVGRMEGIASEAVVSLVRQ